MKRLALPTLISLAGVSLIGLLIYGVTAQSASRTLDEAVAQGQHPRAPDATRSLQGLSAARSVSLSSFHGKVVVLNFWASWCEPCQTEAPLLEHAQSQLERHGATVLGVTYLDASPDSERFVRHYHLTYPNLRDSDGEFAHSYGTDQLPESFIIDRQGRVFKLRRGEIDQAFLNSAITLAESS